MGLQEAPAALGTLLADRLGAEKRVRIPFNPRERWLSAAREACRGLADGVLACDTVTCPWHGSQFDVRSGAVRSGPAEKPISTYSVTETGGEVRLTVPSNRTA